MDEIAKVQDEQEEQKDQDIIDALEGKIKTADYLFEDWK